MSHIEQLQEDAERALTSSKIPAKEPLRIFLSFLRQLHLTTASWSGATLRFAIPLLSHYCSSLAPDEECNTREQVFLAALHSNQIALAEQQLHLLKAKLGFTDPLIVIPRPLATYIDSTSGLDFDDYEDEEDGFEATEENSAGEAQRDVARKAADSLKPTIKSLRLAYLEALLQEAKEEFGSATKMYKAILKVTPLNALVHKRLIAIAKAQDKPLLAIRLLTRYLSVFMADEVAYLELADLYLSLCKFGLAAFCLEEVILSSPNNYHVFNRYADTLYSMGGDENLIKARQYFVLSLKIESTSNNRAIFGLYQTCNAIALLSSKKKEQSDENKTLLDLASKKIKEIYDRPGAFGAPLVQAVLNLPSPSSSSSSSSSKSR